MITHRKLLERPVGVEVAQAHAHLEEVGENVALASEKDGLSTCERLRQQGSPGVGTAATFVHHMEWSLRNVASSSCLGNFRLRCVLWIHHPSSVS